MTAAPPGVAVGTDLELEVGPVAHGGHCVARHDGQVVFVRYALPGELVRATVTSRTARFLRADAVEVLRPAAGRVEPPCRHARPGGCGGCDWQHADLPTQRGLKAAVVAEQLRRLGGVTLDVVVEEVPGAPDGLGWRTRERFAVDGSGRPGLRRHRSHEVQLLGDCPLAAPAVLATGVLARSWPGASEVLVAASSTSGDAAVMVDGVVDGMAAGAPGGRRRLRERAVGREWRVDLTSFWQVHPGGADALAEAVRHAVGARPGERAVDLYAGVGLFAAVLAEEVGPAGRVDAVESGTGAVRDARRALHDLPVVRLHEQRVDRWLADDPTRRADLIVLDPPRTGAGATVLAGLLALRPRAVCYVACDPAALARDVRTFGEHGWRLAGLRAFDLFPMTHHVECVARFEPVADARSG